MGIDYSPRGSTINRDPATGIRYGIVPMSVLSEFAHEAFIPEYDEYCPHCGACADYGRFDDDRCDACGETSCAEERSGDEASRFALAEDEYSGILDEQNDVWVFKSPYYTLAGFCSPCAPGACYLTSGYDAKAYCLGHDWFDEEGAPYPVYSVATDELISRPKMRETYDALRKLGIMVTPDVTQPTTKDGV